MAKLYCGRAAFEVCDTALQVMGGIGYTKDCRISRLWRDQRVYRIGAGTDEIDRAGRAPGRRPKRASGPPASPRGRPGSAMSILV